MKNLGYYNGEYGLLEEMKVPMLDRACYFGDGVYDASLARNHKIFAIDDHIDRFFNSAKLMEINIPHTKEEIKNILNDMVAKVDASDLFVYWQITRGTAQRNHIYPENMQGNLWIMIWEGHLTDRNTLMDLVTREDTRFLHNNIKSLNLIPAVMNTTFADRNGYQECVLHRGDRVTECAHSNISILKDGCFITAPADEYILPGIARKHLIEACHRLNVPVEERIYTLDELMSADEIIVSSSSHLCISAKTVDGKNVGGKDKDLLMKMQNAVFDEFMQETEL